MEVPFQYLGRQEWHVVHDKKRRSHCCIHLLSQTPDGGHISLSFPFQITGRYHCSGPLTPCMILCSIWTCGSELSLQLSGLISRVRWGSTIPCACEQIYVRYCKTVSWSLPSTQFSTCSDEATNRHASLRWTGLAMLP